MIQRLTILAILIVLLLVNVGDGFSSSSSEACKNVATIIGKVQSILVGSLDTSSKHHLYLAAWCRATVQGTVKAREGPMDDGDYHVLIKPTQTKLAGQNQDLRQGCAVAASTLNHHDLKTEDFYPTDLLLLEINPGPPPEIGAEISGWGAWVYDNDSADLQATADGQPLGPARGHHCEVHPFIWDK